MLVHNLVVTGSLTFPTALPISGSLLVSGSATFSGSVATNGNITINKTSPNIFMRGGYTQDLGFFLNNEPAVYIVDDATATKGMKVNISTGAITQLGSGSVSFTGAATFSGNVKVNGTPIATSGILSVVTSTSTLGATDALGLLITNDGSVGKMSQIGFGYSESRTGAVIGGIISNGAGSTSSDLFFATRATTDGATAPTERMRITSAGSVGIGVTNPTYKLDIFNGSDFDIRLRDTSLGGTVGILFESANDFSGTSQSYIKGVGASNSGVSYLIFGTANTSGAVTGSERMRITADGYLKATSTGTYNDVNASNFEFVNGTASANSFFVGNTNTSYASATLLRINGSRTTTNATYNLIGATNGNSTGEFRVADSGNATNTNGSYGAISDIKLKQDIIDASSQWEDIKQMRIRKFRFKKQVEQDENAPYLLGVIAQELELISPNLVDEALDFDGADEEVTSTTKSVKYSIIYMKAVKALQEAMAKIETLETTIETLTTRITALEN